MGSAGKMGGAKAPRPWYRQGLRLEGRGTADMALAAEPPLRSELFSADQMEQHGLRLASADRLTPRRVPERLLARLAANERLLVETCHLLTAAVTAKQRVTPAGEWLLDNAYLVAEQIRTARRHLPKGYSRELPSLATGHLRRPAARLWHRPGDHRPRRRTGRSRQPQPVRCGLPEGRPPAAWRVVGHPHHVATGSGRESTPGRGARCR